MPYQAGRRLGGETASKLGHLDVIQSQLVNDLIQEFCEEDPPASPIGIKWDSLNLDEKPLRLIFAVDGSKQSVRSDKRPFKELSFVKTALLRLDQNAIAKVDQRDPHPMALRDIMRDAAMFHATVLPLKGVRLPDTNTYHAVRKIIYDSLRDKSLKGEPFKTLKWLAYESWTDHETTSPNFDCPHCSSDVPGLAHQADTGQCPHCGGELYLSDMIGFHLEMDEDSAPDSVSTAYMLIHETLLLFTGIRYFWEQGKFKTLENALFFKDGPLTLRGQYSKLAIPIRRFFEHTKRKGIRVHVAGQEKTGAFVDHLEIIGKDAPLSSVFVPSNEYIRKEIQHRPERSEPYGKRTNYGNKVFIKLGPFQDLVLSIPTGEYMDSKSKDDLIGFERIVSTLPSLVSHRHECALVPIELANGVASLSNYPSAAILKMFADLG